MTMLESLSIKPVFAIDDPVLPETDLTACTLLLQIGAQHFNYTLFHEEEKKFLTLKSYHYQFNGHWKTDLEMVEHFFNVDKILYTAFRKILVAFNVPKNTLVPQNFFYPSIKREQLQLIYGEIPHETIMADHLPELGLVNIYAAKKDLVGFLRKEFPQLRFFHTDSCLMKTFFKRKDPGRMIYLIIQLEWMSLIAMENGQVFFQKQFYYQTPADLVYHTLNVTKMLEWDIQESRVLLGGNISMDSAAFEELNRFIPQLDWLGRPQGVKFSEKFLEQPSQYFFNLFSLALCE
ncbi:MAG: DUF3822 family protein [Chitinophagaceae bacterium]